MSSLDDLGQAQHGLVTGSQAVEALGAWSFRRAVETDQLVGVRPSVYRCAGTGSTFRQRAMAACLAFGAPVAVSHRSAAALWAYEPVDPGPEIEVSVPSGRSGRRTGIRAHRVVLPEVDITRRYGIPVTCPGRTLLDLAASLAPPALERCVDDALRARHATVDELLGWVAQEDRRVRGKAALVRLLELRGASGVGDSVGVDRIYRWISRAGLPAPVLGLAVTIAGRLRFVDLGYPTEKVAIEFNGWEYHQMRSRMDADHARTTELELAGWLVIVVTEAHREDVTVDRIARALALRGGDVRSGHRSGMLGG